jgi:hypothetical protein
MPEIVDWLKKLGMSEYAQCLPHKRPQSRNSSDHFRLRRDVAVRPGAPYPASTPSRREQSPLGSNLVMPKTRDGNYKQKESDCGPYHKYSDRLSFCSLHLSRAGQTDAQANNGS